jgi:hypothetical protein
MVTGTKKVYTKTKKLKKTRKAKRQAQKASTIEAVYFPIKQQVDILLLTEPANTFYLSLKEQLKFTQLSKPQKVMVKKDFENKVLKKSTTKITSGYWYAKKSSNENH